MDTVLVLGANGHLGTNLTRRLVERGYRVRAGVRSAADPARTAHLKPLGVELVDADITNPSHLRAAMEGVDGVFQCAAVFNVTSRRPRQEVWEPTVNGTLNAVRAAAGARVRKLVLTSSIVAVGTVKPGGSPRDESHWNYATAEPYARAKMQAERGAWRLAWESGLNLVTVLPATMIGPGFQRATPSTLIFERLFRGTVPFALPLSFNFVDVRDVAEAHVLAYENPAASGRYIASNTVLTLKELFERIRVIDPDLRVPARQLPAALLPAVPYFESLGHLVAGYPRLVSPAFIEEYAGREQHVSSARLRRELGWTTRPIETSIRDTLDWVRSRFTETEGQNARLRMSRYSVASPKRADTPHAP